MSDEQNKYLLVNGLWLIDGNYFSKEFCKNDIKLAEQYSKTLLNCFGCVDCRNCVNCNHCVGCNNCKDCEHSSSCNNCDKCSYCISCTNCSGCESVTGANRLKMQTIPQHNAPITMQPFSYR